MKSIVVGLSLLLGASGYGVSQRPKCDGAYVDIEAGSQNDLADFSPFGRLSCRLPEFGLVLSTSCGGDSSLENTLFLKAEDNRYHINHSARNPGVDEASEPGESQRWLWDKPFDVLHNGRLEVLVYEDGQLISRSKSAVNDEGGYLGTVELQKQLSGTHTYRFEVTDGKTTVSSAPMKVHFSAEERPATVALTDKALGDNPDDHTLFFDVKDAGANSGIRQMALLENGKLTAQVWDYEPGRNVDPFCKQATATFVGHGQQGNSYQVKVTDASGNITRSTPVQL